MERILPAPKAPSRFLISMAWMAAAVILQAGCDAGGSPVGGWQAVVDTVGDTITVRTLSGGDWAGPARLEEEIRLGVVEGDDAYMLGRVSGLAVSPAGDILAIDVQVPALRRYGPDGRHIATIGREGGGPGEYRRPDGGLAVLSDGRVLLRDPGNARIDVYAADGSILGEWRLPGGGTFNTSRKLYTDTAGNAYTLVLQDRTAQVIDWKYGLARFASDGTHTDTVLVPEFDYERSVITGQTEGNSSVSDVPFTANAYWTFSPFGYVIAGISTDYRIELHRPEGLLRIEKDWTPVPVDPAEGSDLEELVAANMRRQFPGWRWNGPPVPETKPPFRGLFTGEDGRIWVVLSRTGEAVMTERDAIEEEQRTGSRPIRFREPVSFDVFEADGRYIGRVDTPTGFTLNPTPVFRGDRVWATIRDELDVTYIVRYRVVSNVAE